jgi:hypothetical protein
MKLLISFLVVIFISTVGVNAFTTPVATVANTFTRLQAQQQQNDNADADGVVYSRRDALRKSATTFASVASVGVVLATTTVMIIPTMPAHADIYDDQEKERKLKRAQDSEEQKKLIPKILLGGVGLSSVFIIPNLIRLAKKILSGGNNDGYGS